MKLQCIGPFFHHYREEGRDMVESEAYNRRFGIQCTMHIVTITFFCERCGKRKVDVFFV